MNHAMLSLRTTPISREWVWRFVGGAALAVLILIVFARSFGSDLVFDSRVVIGDDPRLQTVSASTIKGVLSENYWWPTMRSNLYRPLTTFSFMAEYSILGYKERATGYQLTNLILHAGAALLCFSLLRRMGAAWGAAWFCAAWFAVHPFATEIIPNVVGRSDLLAILSILWGLGVYLDILSKEKSPGRGLVLLGVIALVGVLSKESATSLIGLVVWHGLTLGRGQILGLWRERILGRREIIGALVMVVLIGFAVIIPKLIFEEPAFDAASIGGDNPLQVVSWWDARLNALAIMGHNLLGCIVPLEISADYSYNQIPLAHSAMDRAYDWQVFAWAAGALGFGILGLALVRRWPALSFAIGAVFILLLPTSNVIVLIGTIRADRLAYPAVFPMVVCVGLLARRLLEYLERQPGSSVQRWRRVTGWGLGTALIVLGAFTHMRGSEWRTTRQFWQSLTITAPNSHKAKSGWASVLSRDGNLSSAQESVRLSEESIHQIESATDIKILKSATLIEMDASIHLERGRLLRDAGQIAEAQADFSYAKAALEAQVLKLGAINEEFGRQIDAGLRSPSEATLKMDEILISLSELERYDLNKKTAHEILAKYLRYNRLLPSYLQALGRALVDDGQWEAGLEYLLEAALIKPTDTLVSGEAAWIWEHHTLPPSALPLMSIQMKKGVPALPLIDLGDHEFAARVEKAALRVVAVLETHKLPLERSAFIRQVRFRVAKPDWLSDLK